MTTDEKQELFTLLKEAPHPDSMQYAYAELSDIEPFYVEVLKHLPTLIEAHDLLMNLPCMFQFAAKLRGLIEPPRCPDLVFNDDRTQYLLGHAWCPVCKAKAKV